MARRKLKPEGPYLIVPVFSNSMGLDVEHPSYGVIRDLDITFCTYILKRLRIVEWLKNQDSSTYCYQSWHYGVDNWLDVLAWPERHEPLDLLGNCPPDRALFTHLDDVQTPVLVDRPPLVEGRTPDDDRVQDFNIQYVTVKLKPDGEFYWKGSEKHSDVPAETGVIHAQTLHKIRYVLTYGLGLPFQE